MANIYLVGFMGTGKTCVGKELAKRNKRCFVDLDELIELKEKRIIAEIFAQDGEAYFRRVEHQALKDVAREQGLVVACGGGIVINEKNIGLMKETGTLVCLAATPEVIFKRTAGHGHRPLLNVADRKRQINLLIKLRAPYYAQAHKTIDTSKLSVRQVVQRILKYVATAKSQKSKVKRQK
jgi:shikimate kinase